MNIIGSTINYGLNNIENTKLKVSLDFTKNLKIL